MSIPLFDLFLAATISGAVVLGVSYAAWGKRLAALERDLRSYGEAICQLADSQMAFQRKVSGVLGEMEEKILDVAVPSRDAGRNLDRRHRVLSLARRGVALDDIARQLKVPRGEAELILSLRKYMDRGAVRPVPAARES